MTSVNGISFFLLLFWIQDHHHLWYKILSSVCGEARAWFFFAACSGWRCLQFTRERCLLL
jgi:hypothetical protein